MIKLLHGDCLSIMDKLKADGVKVNAVITDPPYNISQQNRFTTMGRKGIDFGEWDKNVDLTTWVEKATPLLDKNGSIISFTGWQQLSYINKALEANGMQVKDLIRYVKNNPMPRNRDRRYIVDFELAVWAVKKGAKWVFNRKNATYDRPLYMCSIPSKQLHPTQKPLPLMEEIIKTHTNEGDIVLDPFMGSGTTGVACKKLNRSFIGIELDKTYFDTAEKRINDRGIIPCQ